MGEAGRRGREVLSLEIELLVSCFDTDLAPPPPPPPLRV